MLNEITGDMWDEPFWSYRKCVLINCSVDVQEGQLRNPMGGGCAYEARVRYPGLEYRTAKGLELYGHHTFVDTETGLIMFPTKHEIWEQASMVLIKRSLRELIAIMHLYDWRDVLLPRPGCGLGGLDWKYVRPEVEMQVQLSDMVWPGLEDRISVIDYGDKERSGLFLI